MEVEKQAGHREVAGLGQDPAARGGLSLHLARLRAHWS